MPVTVKYIILREFDQVVMTEDPEKHGRSQFFIIHQRLVATIGKKIVNERFDWKLECKDLWNRRSIYLGIRLDNGSQYGHWKY